MTERCPVCGRLSLEVARLHGEEPCKPSNCTAWKVVGKSKNGGPLLRLVEGAE